jgi:hypothetical protein
MAFTRDELLSLKNAPLQRVQEVYQILFEKLHSGKVLTLAESKHICLGLKATYNEKGERAFEVKNFKLCDDFLFWEKYLLYWGDHEGWGLVRNGSNSYVSIEQKANDVEFLNDHYGSWRKVILNDRHESAFLQTVANETNKLIREITNHSRQRGEGSNRRKYIEKALILHSKYVYFQVKEYYEEINANEETINFVVRSLYLITLHMSIY